jgi:hypothetical protein
MGTASDLKAVSLAKPTNMHERWQVLKMISKHNFGAASRMKIK